MATLADLLASRAAVEATRPLTEAEAIEYRENLALVAARTKAPDADAKAADATEARRAFYEAAELTTKAAELTAADAAKE